jgi:hypothetical protein
MKERRVEPFKATIHESLVKWWVGRLFDEETRETHFVSRMYRIKREGVRYYAVDLTPKHERKIDSQVIQKTRPKG